MSSPAGLLRLGSNGHLINNSARRKPSLQYGLEVVAVQARTLKSILSEGYIQGGLGKFYLYGGRKREVIGLGDSTLSSGFYSWSQNAIPIPKIQFGTQGFVSVPFTGGVLAVNALFAHGWFPNTDSMQHSYLHQKALYGRIGKPNWRVKLYGGIVHNAQWGGYSRFLGNGLSRNGRLPSSLKDYSYIIFARQPAQLETDGYSKHDGVNRFGNHVGSIDIGAEIALKSWTALAYYQHPFEDKSGLALVNMPDGLYGLSIKRGSQSSPAAFQINHLLLEYLTTLSQSGSSLNINRRQYEGIDDYFNNFQFLDGWSSGQRVLGTPFISRRQDVKEALQQRPGRPMAMINNRVQLWHMGLKGLLFSKAEVQLKLSLSQNSGTYRASFPGNINQFSGLFSLSVPVGWLNGSALGAAIAVDQGSLYANNLGGWLSLRKTWHH